MGGFTEDWSTKQTKYTRIQGGSYGIHIKSSKFMMYLFLGKYCVLKMIWYLFTELVFKARLANSDDRDFIEVELDKNMLTYEALLNLLCAELGVERRLVHKIRKLPDTVVRKDKDVRRLVDFQALELVLTNKAVSASSRNYGYSGSPGIRSEQILY